MSSLAEGRMRLVLLLMLVLAIGSVAMLVNHYSSDSYLDDYESSEFSMDVPDLSTREAERKIQDCFEENPGVPQRDWCYLNLARKYRIDACSDIIQEDHSTFCRSVVDADPSICTDISSNSMRDSCFIAMAQLSGDPSLCDSSDRPDYCLSLI